MELMHYVSRECFGVDNSCLKKDELQNQQIRSNDQVSTENFTISYICWFVYNLGEFAGLNKFV